MSGCAVRWNSKNATTGMFKTRSSLNMFDSKELEILFVCWSLFGYFIQRVIYSVPLSQFLFSFNSFLCENISEVFFSCLILATFRRSSIFIVLTVCSAFLYPRVFIYGVLSLSFFASWLMSRFPGDWCMGAYKGQFVSFFFFFFLPLSFSKMVK